MYFILYKKIIILVVFFETEERVGFSIYKTTILNSSTIKWYGLAETINCACGQYKFLLSSHVQPQQKIYNTKLTGWFDVNFVQKITAACRCNSKSPLRNALNVTQGLDNRNLD